MRAISTCVYHYFTVIRICGGRYWHLDGRLETQLHISHDNVDVSKSRLCPHCRRYFGCYWKLVRMWWSYYRKQMRSSNCESFKTISKSFYYYHLFLYTNKEQKNNRKVKIARTIIVKLDHKDDFT